MSLNSTTETILLPSRLGSALGGIIAFFFIIFGLLGDALIITAILSKKDLRKNLINIFIVSLQLNDIFNIGFNQFLVGLSYTFMKWYGPYIICEIFVYTSIICTGSLLWHHALISIHRYLVVVCNFNINKNGKSPKIYIIVSIILSRLIPVLVCTPAFLNQHMTVYSPIALRCMLAPNVSGFQNLLIVLINMLLPCLIVIICFAYIFAKVRNVSKNIRHKPNHQFSKTACLNSSNLKREIKITKMFAIIFTVFLFGYLPYGIIRLVDKDNDLHPDFYVFLTVLFILSISISPIVYGLMNTQIKNQCVAIISKIFQCKQKEKVKSQKIVGVVEPQNEDFQIKKKSFLARVSSTRKNEVESMIKREDSRDEYVAKSSENDSCHKNKLSISSVSISSTNSIKNKKLVKKSQDDYCKYVLLDSNQIQTNQKHSSKESLDNNDNISSNKIALLDDDGGVYKGPP
ncbi:unnamed protein product [Brachionus calyciflorus]|uniref:G-protein coupled receptors family 1 profile domain-containing protein n=1 Tax=Brachionus calyciflorus TaxID=104777 RepID=A0A813Z585_9BILA|nr:unnamed protein product [Brachionus calyciflorus]